MDPTSQSSVQRALRAARSSRRGLYVVLLVLFAAVVLSYPSTHEAATLSHGAGPRPRPLPLDAALAELGLDAVATEVGTDGPGALAVGAHGPRRPPRRRAPERYATPAFAAGAIGVLADASPRPRPSAPRR